MIKNNKKIIVSLILVLIIILILILILPITTKNDFIWEFNLESRINNLTSYDKIPTEEIIGWIQVQGTNIDLPITQHKEIKNIDYYTDLSHAWISNRYEEGKNRKAFYGHNIQNVGSKPLIVAENHERFEQLMSFTNYDFSKNNLYIQYTHDGVDEIYKIYAVGFYLEMEERGLSYSRADTNFYIQNAKNESIYDYDVDVNSDDELISLITCTRFFGNDGKTQFRVDARKIRKNEKIEKYTMKKNENYDILIKE